MPIDVPVEQQRLVGRIRPHRHRKAAGGVDCRGLTLNGLEQPSITEPSGIGVSDVVEKGELQQRVLQGATVRGYIDTESQKPMVGHEWNVDTVLNSMNGAPGGPAVIADTA